MSERLVLQVEGMDCAGCEQRLTAAVRRVEGVLVGAADHRAGVLDVQLTSAAAAAAVTARVTQAGYTVTGSEVR